LRWPLSLSLSEDEDGEHGGGDGGERKRKKGRGGIKCWRVGRRMCWNTSIYWGETWSMLVRNGEPLEYKHKEEETSVSVN